VTIAIGDFEMTKDESESGVPITYWTPRGDPNALERMRFTPEAMAWLEAKLGPYPFSTLGSVVVDSESAMETQEMITLGAARGYAEETLLHELAHQWFGDAVTPTDWSGVWLNEGLAMYTEWLWSVDVNHVPDKAWLATAEAEDRASRPVAGPPGKPARKHFAESIVYFGPALMLHEIHHTIGDRKFFALLRDWVQQHRNQQVDRAMFVAFVNSHTGRDFTKLMNRWLDSPKSPLPDVPRSGGPAPPQPPQ
jgi:aminopeptidase N